MFGKALGVLALAAIGTTSFGVQLNEIFINPPGSDNGLEFVELCGVANESLDNLWLLAIEGDGTAAGVVDQAINLTGRSLGANGIHLQRDAAAAIKWRDAGNAWAVQTGPEAGTSVTVADFAPDIENGSNTYLLVSHFSGAVGNDLDTNDDGALDLTPWSSVQDAIGISENDTGNNFQYATGLGFFGFAANAGFNADILFRTRNSVSSGGEWFSSDLLSTTIGSDTVFAVDPARYAAQGTLTANAIAEINAGNLWTATPGGKNPVPEPATMVALAAGLTALARKRRK